MNAERLALMWRDAVGYDLETHLIQPGLVTPPPVLGSLAVPELVDQKINLNGKLLDKEQARAVFLELLANERYTICGAKIAYDVCVMAVDFARRGLDVMPDIFAAYDPDRSIIRSICNGRVFDVQIAERLHAIAQGHLNRDRNGKEAGYSLEDVTKHVKARENAKVNDRFRLRYAEFDDLPLDQLPFEARTYPVDDAINTLDDALGQAGHSPSAWAHEWEPSLGDPNVLVCSPCGTVFASDAPHDCMRKRPRRNLHDLSRQTYAGFAFDLSATWGFRVNQTSVDGLEQKYVVERAKGETPFREAGIIREDGTENQAVLKKLVAEAYGARNACQTCNGGGKVPSPKTNGKTKINCATCDGTGLELTRAVPRSDAGGVCKNRDALQESGSTILENLGIHKEGEKIETTYIPLLRSARACNVCGRSGAKTKRHPAHETWCTAPAGEAGYREVPLLPRPTVIVETGRCAYPDGLHGMPRKGGVRECIEARSGWVLSSSDYTAGELVTHAQTCLELVGYSRLAEALNLGLDAHLALAGTMIGKSYEQMKALKKAGDKLASDNRQAGKAANFGFPGGMAELTFTIRKRTDPDCFTPCPDGPDERKGVRGFKGLRTCILMDGADYCGGRQGELKVTEYNNTDCSPVCIRCLAASKQLREFWFKQWPENNPRDGYFKKIKDLIAVNGPSGLPEIVQRVTNRVRAGVDFCSGANSLFQGRLADAAKNAYCQIVRESFDRTCRVENSEHMTSKFAGGPSPLLGSHPIMLAHDESIVEHPESVAHEAANRVGEIMVEALRFMCPQMSKACRADPALMRRLYKSAEPVHDVNGRLIPWEPS